MTIDFFDTIQLKQMDEVKLMNRIEKKYWFHKEILPELLQSVRPYYYMLSVEGKSKLPYKTTYYDTVRNEMYTSHHNGKLNRFKIRRRTYVASRTSFLEVKFKNNKKRIIKKRISIDNKKNTFSKEEAKFVNWHSPFSSDELQACLSNNFSRLTLVNKNFKERCTIDLNLHFSNAKNSLSLGNLVIVEIKSDGNLVSSPLEKALRKHGIKPSGFSKYCIGRSIIEPYLKRNSFKKKIMSLEKMVQPEEILYINN